jgi:hypothetical protein
MEKRIKKIETGQQLHKEDRKDKKFGLEVCLKQ